MGAAATAFEAMLITSLIEQDVSHYLCSDTKEGRDFANGFFLID